MNAHKAALRKELRARRRGLSATEHAQRSNRAAQMIARLPQFSAGSRIALYLPFDAEVDTAGLIAVACRRGIRSYVPVVSDARHGRIGFYPLAGPTRRGRYGILVPHRNVGPVDPRWLDLVVVPLVGVDAAGKRLGMGAGYYDRVMAFRRGRVDWRGPRLIGLAFDCQRVESISAEPWDLGLDYLATETGLLQYHGGGSCVIGC